MLTIHNSRNSREQCKQEANCVVTLKWSTHVRYFLLGTFEGLIPKQRMDFHCFLSLGIQQMLTIHNSSIIFCLQVFWLEKIKQRMDFHCFKYSPLDILISLSLPLQLGAPFVSQIRTSLTISSCRVWRLPYNMICQCRYTLGNALMIVKWFHQLRLIAETFGRRK